MESEVQQARVDLAAALRLAARFDFSEGVCNHFSYQLPSEEERFLINPHGIHWSLMRAGDNMARDVHGNIRTFAGDYAAKHFEALKQVLDREDSGYRD